jgi:hypothetical protein
MSDYGSALGLVAKTYFEYLKDSKEVTPALKEELKSGQGDYKWFPHAKNKNLGKSLETIRTIWDAALAGSEVAEEQNKDENVFQQADEWLKPRW